MVMLRSNAERMYEVGRRYLLCFSKRRSLDRFTKQWNEGGIISNMELNGDSEHGSYRNDRSYERLPISEIEQIS